MKAFLAIGSFSLLGIYSIGWSQPIPELIELIPEAFQQEIASRNDYFVREHAYWSKRYRIVSINHEVLRQAGRVRISLFDDLVLTARTVQLDETGDGKSFTWFGELEESPFTAEVFAKEGVPDQLATEILNRFSIVKIAVSEIGYDTKERRKIYRHHLDFIKSTRTSWEGKPYLNVSSKIDLYLNLSNPEAVERIHIRPFDQEVGYHLIMQEDSSKMFGVGHPGKPVSDEMLRRKQDYNNYMRSLGSDPDPNLKPRKKNKEKEQ